VLLLSLPLLVLLVPQGVQEKRSGVWEAAFAIPCFLAACMVTARWVMLRPNPILPRHQLNPLLLLTLVYFELINPVWSLWLGNEGERIFMTAIPFSLMGVYYLFALRSFDLLDVRRVVWVVTVSGVILAFTIIIVFFVGDLAQFDMRASQIADERNLSLPLLANAGVLSLCYALTSVRRKRTALAWAVGAVVILVAVLMTVTRALLMAYLVGAAATVMLLVRRATRSVRGVVIRRLLAGAVLCSLVGIPFVPRWMERISGGDERDIATVLGRLDEYRAFYEAFLSSPLLGQGMGYVVTDSAAVGYQMRTEGVMRPHSSLVFFAGTTGLVGLLLYYGLLSSAFKRLWRASYAVGDTDNLALIAGMAGAGIAGVLYTLTSTTYSALSYNIFLGILMFTASITGKRQ
jgi:O-antigen ligase